MNDAHGTGGASSGHTGAAPGDGLAARLSDLARQLQGEQNVQDTLDAIVAGAVDTVPGAELAGLMVVERRRNIDTRAVTDDLARHVDQVQYDTGQGPCLDAIHRQRTVRIIDLAAETRWPEFALRAVELGIRSMLSFQLYVRHGNLGALNLYAREADAFDDESEHTGLLFAAHAAVAMSDARQVDQLNRAVVVRDLIGQAKGILMERHRLTADQAFVLLVRASQATNTKLLDVARHLTETGEL
ncbi:ANTAR domain-containing protein [Virgisporangium ochraceum]|uniref:Transcriptional regulator n=1 Tax=Virgisporangium ochraceum TaxID=65505 RepID=A0A8J4A3P2_9ACTN|nr:GAF and ANTAR domain-containing protein [Virgisporangium ochraceum]GIJ74566.1 transcriptional regulator [Virgisporangium ochraceum]